MNYQQQTLAVMNSVDLVVALYDGMVRFLHRAMERIEAAMLPVAGCHSSRAGYSDLFAGTASHGYWRQTGRDLGRVLAAIYAQCVRGSRDASCRC